RIISGQWQVATCEGRVEEVRLTPARPRVPDAVIEAIQRADWVIVGPGSWYTSVLPHLMIPEIAEAIRSTSARRCITTNLSVGQQEAEGMTSLDLLEVLLEHADGTRFDALVADPTTLEDALTLSQAAEGRGIRTLLRQVSAGDGRPRHDPVRLAAAYRDLFDDVYGDVEPGPRTPDPPPSTADPPSEEDLHGTDRRCHGGAEPPRGHPALGPPGGGGRDAALRRRAASAGGTGGGGGRAGLRRGRQTPAGRHRGHVRSPRRGRGAGPLGDPPHHPLHRAGRAGGADAG